MLQSESEGWTDTNAIDFDLSEVFALNAIKWDPNFKITLWISIGIEIKSGWFLSGNKVMEKCRERWWIFLKLSQINSKMSAFSGGKI